MFFRDEQPGKFTVGVIAQLARYRRGLTLDAQKLEFRRELHDFIGGQQVTAHDAGAGCRHVAGFVAFRLITDDALPHRLAQPLGRLKIIHAEDLLYPGIGHEGRGACAVKIAELAHG